MVSGPACAHLAPAVAVKKSPSVLSLPGIEAISYFLLKQSPILSFFGN